MFSLVDLIRWRAHIHPDQLALVDDRGDRATYGRLMERIDANARRWSARGVTAGDRVAVLDTNSVDNVVNVFGLSRMGAIPALLNWRLTATENRAVLARVKPVAVVAGADLIDRLPHQLPDIRLAIGTAPAGWAGEGDAVGTTVTGASALPSSADSDAVFALAFSSGTTGQPKAVPWRHESLARSTMVDGAECAGMSIGARHLLVAPMFHLAGMSNMLMGLARGAEIHLRTGFDPGAVLHDIEELGIQFMTAVPAMFRAMVHEARTRPSPVNTSTMLEMSYGASPIAPELIREIQELFPATGLRQFYGMTEIGGALCTLRPDDHLTTPDVQQSAGRVNPGFDVRLVDRDGNEVPDGQPGEILIRGRSVMTGYWEDPEATAEVLTDGWFASGDIATYKNGFLTIMDRAKDMIVSGGENVFPAEVEAVLYGHPDIADVAVIGVPDDRWGERVHAVVVGRDEEARLDLQELQGFARERLAGYKLPRSMEQLGDLPRNASGKILKRQLRAPHWEGQVRAV